MKILVVSHSCVTPVNQQLYAEVALRTGWTIDIVVPSNWRDEYGRTWGVERWPTFTGQLIGIPVWLSGNIILHTYKTSFRKLIRRMDPDVIYVNHEPYAVATAQVYWGNAQAGRRPIGWYSTQNILKKYPVPFRWMEKKVLANSHYSFPATSVIADVFRQKGYVGTSSILPLAIDLQTYYPRPEAKEIRESLVSGDEILIGYLGRLVQEKGLRTLVRALAKMSVKNWKLLLVGAGELESELRKEIALLGLESRVYFQGPVAHVDAPKFLSAMDILVLPSETQANWKEQFGRVVLEAMACGTPVVGSDSGEIPTLIRQTGGGLVFRERDASDLANKLSQLVGDAPFRKSLATAGAAVVADTFSVPAVAEKFAATIRSVVENGSRSTSMVTADRAVKPVPVGSH